ncbi:MAG TPA: ring-cleaving dioxygenase [Tepidisphaeraceae bacterium]|jgi:glyoxalase family protein
MQLHGFHHLTAVTADVRTNHEVYTRSLGLRLVKKTVNQDDTSAYHLFYADGLASPGTDITFFDWPVLPEKRGTGSIVRTGFRVSDAAALDYWHKRLKELRHVPDAIVERDGRSTLDFEDREGQRLSLVVDPTAGSGNPWAGSPVPAEHQIRGLGPITLSVANLEPTAKVLTDLMNMRDVRQYTGPATDGSKKATAEVHVFEMGEGGPAAELHVAVEPNLPRARQGAGGVHHVAFRLKTYEEYDAWAERLRAFGVASSGPVDRFYFRSLYFREPNGILFELATDGPGFAADEPMDALGQRLSLPPFLEERRAAIEAGLKPL